MSSTYAWLAALYLGIFLIEFVKGYHKGIHRSGDLLLIASFLMGSAMLRPVMAFATAWVIGLALPAYHNSLADMPFALAVVMVFLVAEFFQYVIHRAAHNPKRHKLLYGMHRTHHSAPFVNITIIYRTNVFWQFVHSYTWTMAVGVYLGLAGPVAVFFVIMMAWNALTHSDWRWDDAVIQSVSWGERFIRGLEWIVITPRMHHTHHGYGKDGRTYNNFCTVLSLYDRIFGTLHTPQGRPYRYGLPGGDYHWLRQSLFPLLPLGEARKTY